MTSRSDVAGPRRSTVVVTDGGLETTLSFLEGLQFPQSAAYVLLEEPEGRGALEDYFVGYLELARSAGVGIELATPTRLASVEWGRRLGHDQAQLDHDNRRAAGLLLSLRARYERPDLPVTISGTIGPRFGCDSTKRMRTSVAAAYHFPQVRQLTEAGIEHVAAVSMSDPAEATGIVDAAASVGVLCSVSWTLGPSGRLRSGMPLGEAIAEVDDETGRTATHFGLDCSSLDAIELAVDQLGSSRDRLGSVRAHPTGEFDRPLQQSTAAQSGDPAEFARRLVRLQGRLPELRVVGGCCGTDERHVEALAVALTDSSR